MIKISFKHIFVISLLIIFSFLFISSSFAAVLRWDPVESTDDCVVAGYRVHYGNALWQYSDEVDVGNITSIDLDALDLVGQIYFFAVNAYSTTGQEGSLSTPIYYYVNQNTDSDNRGIPDAWKAYYGITSAFLDPDSDGLYNRLEYFLGTNPIDSDSDDDGISDGIEVQIARNPLLYDSSEIVDIHQSPIIFMSGFDAEYYLNKKLAALQISDPAWHDMDIISFEILLLTYRFTAETHYAKHGYKEGLSPNAYFNHSEYILAKATAMYNSGTYSSVLEAQKAFNAAWPYDAYLHYILHGAAEGINPSNSFDQSIYFADKLAALQTERSDWDYKTTDDLRNVFTIYGLTVIDHYLSFGKYEGLIPSPVVSTP